MSDVSDYEKKVKTLTVAQLVEENKKWEQQRSEATGEYGYWGGITGSEIVDAELKRRTGKEYQISTSFVDQNGILRTAGTVIMENQLLETMLPALVENFYIKEVKDVLA